MSKKKLTQNKEIPVGTTIKDCQFIGVKFEKQALETIMLVAQGLLNLTCVFKTEGIKIDTLCSVNSSDTTKKDDFVSPVGRR